MKTSILKNAPVLAIVAMMFSSCSKSCCDCSTVSGQPNEVCNDDYPNSGIITWTQYKTTLEAIGCDC